MLGQRIYTKRHVALKRPFVDGAAVPKGGGEFDGRSTGSRGGD
jgi:hypothetical protein